MKINEIIMLITVSAVTGYCLGVFVDMETPETKVIIKEVEIQVPCNHEIQPLSIKDSWGQVHTYVHDKDICGCRREIGKR